MGGGVRRGLAGAVLVHSFLDGFVNAVDENDGKTLVVDANGGEEKEDGGVAAGFDAAVDADEVEQRRHEAIRAVGEEGTPGSGSHLVDDAEVTDVGEDGANPAESVFGLALPSRYPLDSFGHFLGLFHRVS